MPGFDTGFALNYPQSLHGRETRAPSAVSQAFEPDMHEFESCLSKRAETDVKGTFSPQYSDEGI